MNKEKNLNKAADNIRILAAAMVEKAKSGHPGGAMGGADFVNVLYASTLKYNPEKLDYPFRDRFFLDPGHMSPMLYGVLTLAGLIPLAELPKFRQRNSLTPGHPELDVLHGIENTSGPLGQGHAMALGAAIAERFIAQRFGEWTSHKIYTYISDGGVQEEISQGVGRIAGHLGLANFIMYYDSNNVQLSTHVEDVSSENVADKYKAWNWNVIEVNGSNPTELANALATAQNEKSKPTIIIGRTTMGKGAVDANGNSFENKISTHGQPLSAAGADFKKTVANLGGNPEAPFEIFPEAVEIYQQRKAALAQWVEEQQAVESKWRAENPTLANKLDQFLSGKLPEINYHGIKLKSNIATRAASATVLGYFAEKLENMVVASADLSNSDKTDGFLAKTHAFKKGDFSGQFLQAGVSELTMACIMNGMALHGGVIPVCGTFFVFSDYMKPALRLAALMRLHVIYVWTHDSYRVGEDGPTHQPIEHEAQIRLMEQLKNHHGQMSTVVLRPADGAETVAAWKYAVEDKRPVALLLSRQNIKDIPATGNDRLQEALDHIGTGGYLVVETPRQPAVTLVATGAEVATLVEAAQILKEKDNILAEVVSFPSTGLFLNQDDKAQKTVLKDGVYRYGLTAGLPATLQQIVGHHGYIHYFNQFGYSAPYTVLDEEFGFTPELVSKDIKAHVK